MQRTRILTVLCGALYLAALAPAQTAPQITVTPSTARTAAPGAAEHFTGAVRMEPLCTAQAPSRTVCSQVSFAAGARTAWHTHPLGQTLVVTEGEGWIQQAGAPRQSIRKGDVVWIPAGVKHWHGATATSAMSHLAIMEKIDGSNVDWMEQVSEAQYAGKP